MLIKQTISQVKELLLKQFLFVLESENEIQNIVLHSS